MVLVPTAHRQMHPLMTLLYESSACAKPCKDPAADNGTPLSRQSLFASTASRPFPVDLVESVENYVIYADLPGYRREHINLDFDEGERLLHITAKHTDAPQDATWLHRERADVLTSDRERFIELPKDAVAEDAQASLTDGVLTVRVPRQQLKRLQINVE